MTNTYLITYEYTGLKEPVIGEMNVRANNDTEALNQGIFNAIRQGLPLTEVSFIKIERSLPNVTLFELADMVKAQIVEHNHDYQLHIKGLEASVAMLMQQVAELETENIRLHNEIETRERERRYNHVCYMELDIAHNARRSERDEARRWARHYRRWYQHVRGNIISKASTSNQASLAFYYLVRIGSADHE